MFNIKKYKKEAQIAPYEKYHRNNELGPKAENNSPISEKKLPHRGFYEQTTTGDQIIKEHDKDENTQIYEKMLNSATSKLVNHRSDAGDLSLPPINALVEKLRKERRSDLKVDKSSNWTVTFDDKAQNGALPKWPKNAPQHDKLVLENDPNRFSGTNDDPTSFHNDTIKPLIGNITTADVHNIADAVKTGKTVEFDTAMLAILRLANDERRELSNVEQKTIVNLKIARTKSLLQKNA